MLIDLTDKTAIVTGSTGGIGFAIAQGLAASGATVIINISGRAVIVRSKASGPTFWRRI